MGIAFIGGGLMGEAIIKGLIQNRLFKPEKITVSDLSRERLVYLKDAYGVKTTKDNGAASEGADVIVLAIKPQDFPAMASKLKTTLKREQLVLSILAGVSLQKITTSLTHCKAVRAMPNMPAQIGEGITVWTASPETSATGREKARRILGALGKEIFVAQEKYVDMATALSGSGPAYVFVFIEGLIDAGVHIGLPRQIAQELVTKTVLGSVKTMEALAKHPAELRNMVTSPGGTTTDGLLKLERGAIRHLLLEAVTAGFEKAKKLAG